MKLSHAKRSLLVLAVLAAAADDAVRRGRELPRDEGLATLVAYVGDTAQVRRW
jgi:hypothetical protein